MPKRRPPVEIVPAYGTDDERCVDALYRLLVGDRDPREVARQLEQESRKEITQ